jgi:Flp pilus assembly CpaE family ATPase
MSFSRLKKILEQAKNMVGGELETQFKFTPETKAIYCSKKGKNKSFWLIVNKLEEEPLIELREELMEELKREKMKKHKTDQKPIIEEIKPGIKIVRSLTGKKLDKALEQYMKKEEESEK